MSLFGFYCTRCGILTGKVHTRLLTDAGRTLYLIHDVFFIVDNIIGNAQKKIRE